MRQHILYAVLAFAGVITLLAAYLIAKWINKPQSIEETKKIENDYWLSYEASIRAYKKWKKERNSLQDKTE